jgi:ketosteroid isomerase-like protein
MALKTKRNNFTSQYGGPLVLKLSQNKIRTANMKCLLTLLLLSLSLFVNSSVIAQLKTNESFEDKIQIKNKQISNALIAAKIDMLIDNFDDDAVCMPEFQPTMKGKLALKEYYSEILKRRQIISFNKIISETIQLKNDVAEIGTFTVTYKTSDVLSTTLHGKYLNIWMIQQNGNLKLKAESFGYLHAVDNPASHVVAITKGLTNSASAKQSQRINDLAFQLKALNTLMEKCVQTRDGNLRADFFTNDAIFMPFADSAKVGMTSIRKHLIAYNSYPVKIDSINIYNEYFEDCDEYVLEYPKFYVKWRTSENSGVGSGKGIRIWRREKNCSLKLFREIGIHDHLE